VDDDEMPRELADYEPGEARRRPGERSRRLMRLVVVVAIVALVLPGVLVTVSTASRTAELACRIVGSSVAPDAVHEARFDLVGPEGPGWYCYATAYNGREVQLRFLGFIPEVRVVGGGGTRV